MKLIYIILCALCIVFEISVYFDLKKFLNTHANEPVEKNFKGLNKRFALMVAVPVLLSVAMMLIAYIESCGILG